MVSGLIKFLVLVLVIVSIGSCVGGCVGGMTKSNASKFISTSDGMVELSFPAGWHKNPKKHPYDLQCLSKESEMNTGVFQFSTKDLARDTTGKTILGFQIEDLRSKRQNFEIEEPEEIIKLENKVLTTILFSGEKDKSRYFYKYTLVEFNDNSEIFIVVLQVAVPSLWVKVKPILNEIIKSARISQNSVEKAK